MIRRLSGADQSMLWPDDRGWRQDIGVVMVVSGGVLLAPDGSVCLGALRERVERRIHLLPRFRECIHRPPFGLGGPCWVDAVDVDVGDHVTAVRVPAPAGEVELLATWERLRRRPFDPDRPRWELVVGEGMAGNRVAVILRVHHALLDGAAGVAALTALLDEAGDGAAEVDGPRVPWIPTPPPTRRELAADALRRRYAALRSLVARGRRPGTVARRLRAAVVELRRIAALTGAPRTSFNHPIGHGRRVVVVRTPLAEVRDAAHRTDATINDVLLAAVTGGVRALLRSRGEAPAARPLAAVPVAGRDSTTGGNATVSSLVVPLPVELSDAEEVLRTIRDETTRQKRHPLSYAEAGIISSPALERLAARLAGRQRMVNVIVSNVPGPPGRLHLLSGEIVRLLPMVPLNGNIGLGVGALSYAGEVTLVAVGDADLVPDVEVVATGMEQTLAELVGRSLDPAGAT